MNEIMYQNLIKENYIEGLKRQNTMLKNELKYFVKRVEEGTIRSHTTYERFKAVLEKC